MKYLAMALAGLLMVACSKEQGPALGVQPEKTTHEESKNYGSKTSDDVNNNGELGEVAKVTYIVEADGPIGSGQFTLNGEKKTFCGDDDFKFSFETLKQQELNLKAMARKNQVDDLSLKLLINGQPVKETKAQAKDLFKEGELTYHLDSPPNMN